MTRICLVLLLCACHASPPQPQKSAAGEQALAPPAGFPAGPGRAGSCAADSDCHPTGCSETVCASGAPVVSTCEFQAEFACYRAPTTRCGCFQGSCSWEPTAALKDCLSEKMKSP